MLRRTYELDMVPGGIPLSIHLSQYDSDVQLIFQLYASQGALAIPDTGVTAQIRGTKLDGNGISADCTFEVIDSVPTVTVQMTKQMTAIAGKNTFELVLTATSGSSEYSLPGANFYLEVERAALDYEDTDNLETIGIYAFAGLNNLVSVSMPALTAVPISCFRGTAALTDVNLPKVLATNNYSFYYCSTLERIKLPELTIMNEGTPFQNLTALKELRLPKNTSSLSGNKVFSCNALEVLDLGVTTEIGVSLSTSGYAKLTTMILRNAETVVTPYASTIFNTSSPIAKGEGKILVPRSMVASYKADSAWGAYSDVIYAIEDYPELAE